jgi:hypothetical protein
MRRYTPRKTSTRLKPWCPLDQQFTYTAEGKVRIGQMKNAIVDARSATGSATYISKGGESKHTPQKKGGERGK